MGWASKTAFNEALAAGCMLPKREELGYDDATPRGLTNSTETAA